MIRKNRPPDESDTARKIPPGMKVDRRGSKLVPTDQSRGRDRKAPIPPSKGPPPGRKGAGR